MTHIYSLVNQKGGVGKTTTAVNIAAYLAASGKRVLLVDLDSQANATSCLGIDKQTVDGGTYTVLIDETANLQENTLHSPRLKITLLPGSPALAGAEIELVDLPGRENRLRDALVRTQKYDYILIDCPPSLGLLTLNGLVAAQAIIIPVQCEYLALEGLGQLMDTIERVRRTLNPNLSIRGLLMTMLEARANLGRQVIDEVRRYFPDQVFETIVPRNIRLAEAPSHGLPILAYDPRSTGAHAYLSVAREILEGDDLQAAAA